VLPESAGRFWAVVSVKQAYPGHSRQVADAVIGSNTGSYGIKGVITVDEDIMADDLQRVMWALSCRYDPLRGTDIHQARPLDAARPGARSRFEQAHHLAHPDGRLHSL
jgi:UbiD family decarboxylase